MIPFLSAWNRSNACQHDIESEGQVRRSMNQVPSGRAEKVPRKRFSSLVVRQGKACGTNVLHSSCYAKLLSSQAETECPGGVVDQG